MFTGKSTFEGEETKSELQPTEEVDKRDNTSFVNSGLQDAQTSKDETLVKASIALEKNTENENNKGSQDVLPENVETILEENKEEDDVNREDILDAQEKVDEGVEEQDTTNPEPVDLRASQEADLQHTENKDDGIKTGGQLIEHQGEEQANESFREIESNVAETSIQDGAANLIDENQTTQKEETLVAEEDNVLPTTEVEKQEEIEQVNADLRDIDFNVIAANVVNGDEGVNEMNHLIATESIALDEAENSRVIPNDVNDVTLKAEIGAIQDIPDTLTAPVAESENIESMDSSTQETSHQQQENVLSIDGLQINQENSIRQQQTFRDPMSQSAERTQSMFMQPVQNIAVQAYDYTRSLISQTMPIIPSVGMRHEVLSPFTEEQLRIFYFNPELEQITVFIDQFLQVS